MRKNLFIIPVIILLASCQSAHVTMDLAEPNQWKGEKPLERSEDMMVVEEPFGTWICRTGLLNTWKNFELVAEIRTDPGASAVLMFHTGRNDAGAGYEVRIDNSKVGNWDRLLKTGSLSSIRNVCYHMVDDGDWFELKIKVVENLIDIRVNGYPVVHYIEPAAPYRPAELQDRLLGSGTFALKTLYGHSRMYIRKMEVTGLPAGEVLTHPDPQYERNMTQLHARQLPVVDYHVHIKGDLTMDEALEKSASLGINYGIAANCGLKFPIQTDEELEDYLVSIEGLPIFKAMQAEGREWVDMFSPELVAEFDYAFTDAMTWTNRNGTRMRLWIPGETEVGDPQDFMDQLVEQIERVVEEPISIYVNPTYLPAEIAGQYETLWTDERINRVIMALKKNDVALEINSKSKLPGKRFIRRAMEEGVKFAMGTNNSNAENLGRLDWALEMVEEFNLQPTDMFLPGTVE